MSEIAPSSISPILSVCIPTYNFGKFIGETLESIISQITDEVEIVILDGASTDNTREVVESYQLSCPAIRYYRMDKRGGIDHDMALSVDYANGTYCWLFSGDDLIRPGKLKQILAELKLQCDVYLCGFSIRSLDMKEEVCKNYPILKLQRNASFELSNKEERLKYFKLAEMNTAFFSFMSSIVVRRAKWHQATGYEPFIGSLWALSARLLSLIPQGLRVKYLHEPCLDKRNENDSFLDRGIIHRIGMAVYGFHNIAAAFFGEKSREAFHVRRVLINEYSLRVPLKHKFQKLSKEDKQALNHIVKQLYKDKTLGNHLRILIYFLFPIWLYAGIKYLYCSFLKPIMQMCRNKWTIP